MKHNRWFIWLVLILLIINISIFILFKYLHGIDFFKDRFTTIISTVLDADVKMDSFSINEKQLFISNLEIRDKHKQYLIKAHHIYITYNLLKVISAQLNVGQVLKEIRIYDPYIVYNYKYTTKKGIKEDKNLSKWFKTLSINNGTLKLNYQDDHFKYSETLSAINVNIINQKNSKISIQGKINQKGTFKLFLSLKNNKITEIYTEGNNIITSNIKIRDYGTVSLKFNGIYKKYNKLSYFGIKSDSLFFSPESRLSGMISSQYLMIDDFKISGNQNSADFSINALNDRDFIGKVKGKITSPFKDYRIKCIYSFLNIPSPKTNQLFIVKGDLIGELDFYKKKLSLKGVIKSDSLIYHKEKAENILVKFETKDILKQDIIFETKSLKAIKGKISSTGTYNLKDNYLSMNVSADSVSYKYKNIVIKGNINSEISMKNNSPRIKALLSNSSVQYDEYHLKNLEGSLEYEGDNYSIQIKNKNNGLHIEAEGNLKNKQIETEIQMKHFLLSEINNEFIPQLIDANISLRTDEKELKAQLELELFSSNINGIQLKSKGNFKINRVTNVSNLEIKVYDSEFNKFPLSMDIKAKGDMTYLKTEEFSINNVIQANATVGIKPSFYYSFDVSGSQISLNQFTRYFLNESLARDIRGYVSFQSSYNSTIPGSLHTNFAIRQFSYDMLNPADLFINLSGDPNNIKIDRMDLISKMDKILSSRGILVNFGEEFKLEGNLQADLLELIKEAKYKGSINGDFEINLNSKQKTFNLELAGKNLQYKKYEIDQFDLSLEQLQNKLILHQFNIQNSSYLDVKGAGSLDFNIFDDQIYPGSNQININFNANPLKYLSLNNDYILSGDSDLRGQLNIKMTEEGLSFQKSKITLNDGYLKIKGQQESIRNIDLNLDIQDNLILVNKMSAMMGKGTINFRNEITNSDDDFLLGPLNLGILYFKTTKEGLLFHLPYYMPNNSVANFVISGRKSEEAIIKGPFDSMNIIGDVDISNGSGVYPSDSENLLKFINFLREDSHEDVEEYEAEESYLPFSLDVIMYFNENIRYVTYPVNLLVNDSYLWLTYKDGDWSAYEAQFNSDSGTIELFGTVFKAEKVSVRITPFEYNPIINGTFYNKAPDGTTITLEVFTSKTMKNSFFEILQFNLKSDNIDDKTPAQILSKLRYGKSLDELSTQQEESLLQDEALQLVGVGLGTAFIDPYISPIENKIRRFLKLDTFSLNPGFVQNLFNEYKSSDNNSVKNKYSQNDVVNFSSTILLNNLSVNMGRYISRNLFINYEALFQEETDLEKNTNIYMYNNISLRYDLPYKFKLNYEFQIVPNHREDTHQLMLMRTFRF